MITPAERQVGCPRARGLPPQRSHVNDLRRARSEQEDARMDEAHSPTVVSLSQVSSPESLTPKPKRLQSGQSAAAPIQQLSFKDALEEAEAASLEPARSELEGEAEDGSLCDYSEKSSVNPSSQARAPRRAL